MSLSDALRRQVTNRVLPAMATPLHGDGQRVDEAAVAALIPFLLERGAGGLFVGGTTGEGILLARKERERLHQKAVETVAGRAPLILHVGAHNAADAVALAQQAAAIGAAAIAAVTPPFYPIPDEALLAYYAAIAQAAPGIPLLAYDIPQMAVTGVSPELVRLLRANVPTFAGLKTSRGDAISVGRLVAATGPDCLVLAGSERIALAALVMGVDGLVSGLATAVPEPFVRLTQAFAAGDLVAARHWQTTIDQILDQLPFGYRIGTVKSILAERGMPVGAPVPPRPWPPGGPYWPAIGALLRDGSPIPPAH